MAKKEFMYRGKTLDELKTLSHKEFAQYATSSTRRKILRGFNDREKKLLEDVKVKKKNIETHAREMIILPEMVGATIKIYSGKTFDPVLLEPDMLGHCLGEFVLTRRTVKHNAPGIGATRSSAAQQKG
ncbi:30S ribosomal protein S19 [Candidatus Woesearchaeota archaeon]|nr:30S ribosomal protein S19 [Candidatus Woesearchaeota archaeon]